MKSCCVTGHRDIPDDKIQYVTDALSKEIQAAINDGFSSFYSGFAQGTDMIFARLVLKYKEKYPRINLHAALPYPTWLRNRRPEDKDIFRQCEGFSVHSPGYTPSCFFVRNQFMVNTSVRVIAVYDGRKKGGTVNTMGYAEKMERDIRVIRI